MSADKQHSEDDLVFRLQVAQIGSCRCMTKTPDPDFHQPQCLYRVLREAVDEIIEHRNTVERSPAEGDEAASKDADYASVFKGPALPVSHNNCTCLCHTTPG